MHLRSYHSLVLNEWALTRDRVSDHSWGNFSLLCNVIHVLKPPVEGSLVYEKSKLWITAGSSKESIETVSVDHLLLSWGVLNSKGVESEKQCWRGHEKRWEKTFQQMLVTQVLGGIREIISHCSHPAMARATWLCILSINKQDYITAVWICHQNIHLNEMPWIMLVTLIKKG